MRRLRLSRLAAAALIVALFCWILFSLLPNAVSSGIYRTEYEEYVEKYSRDFSVDPALIYAVIKVESNFDPYAHSEVGAIGLMQIIEDSFDWVAWLLKREDLKFEDMYDPEYSIMFGSYMISYLYSKYQSVELTAAAYHAGMSTVDRWIESGEIDPDNVSLSDIKGSSTAHYVKKILKAYEKYSDKLKNERKG